NEAGKPESIRDIAKFDDRGILFATTGTLFFADKNRFPASTAVHAQRIFTQNAIDRIFVDNTRTVWIGSRNGLFNLSPLNLHTRFTSFDNGPYQHMAVNDLLALTKDSLLIASYASGLTLLDTRTHQVTPLATPFKEVKLIQKGQ